MPTFQDPRKELPTDGELYYFIPKGMKGPIMGGFIKEKPNHLEIIGWFRAIEGQTNYRVSNTNSNEVEDYKLVVPHL